MYFIPWRTWTPLNHPHGGFLVDLKRLSRYALRKSEVGEATSSTLLPLSKRIFKQFPFCATDQLIQLAGSVAEKLSA